MSRVVSGGRSSSGRRPRLLAKRAMDLWLAAGALLVLGPAMACIAIAIRWSMGAPILFRQARPGLGGAPFEMVKFRTMTMDTGPDGALLADDARITRLGRLLRHLSVDELPELFNVLAGDMSIVGPRPLLLAYLPRYTPEQARRHEVRPGMTGWAQIHGRRGLLMADRFALDVWYVDHWSMALDIRIILLTAPRVLRGRGVDAPATDAVDPFQLLRTEHSAGPPEESS